MRQVAINDVLVTPLFAAIGAMSSNYHLSTTRTASAL